MAYDAMLKLLTTRQARTFFELLGVHPDRRDRPTEDERPKTLRMDHLSEAVDGSDLLHIEFQSTNEEMRWRMLEYYTVIARRHQLGAASGPPAVRQYVLMVGRANRIPFELNRDFTHHSFTVRRLDSLDGEGRLLRSRDPYERVLGLLCKRQLDDADWHQALHPFRAGSGREDRVLREAGALLQVVCSLLNIDPARQLEIQEITMDLKVEETSLLGTTIARASMSAVRDRDLELLRIYLRGQNEDPEAWMPQFVDLDADGRRDLLEAIMRGESMDQYLQGPTLR